jgi:hypothetical protein
VREKRGKAKKLTEAKLHHLRERVLYYHDKDDTTLSTLSQMMMFEHLEESLVVRKVRVSPTRW